MRKFLLTLMACGLVARAAAAETAWLDSVPMAMVRANKENKIILLDFTGSDWCGWCQELVGDTFSRREFMDYARRNLILVEVDFPMHKAQPAELKAANNALKKQYGVRGFPSIVVIKSDGTVLWTQNGYVPGGARAMIANLDRINPNPRPEAPIAAAVPIAPVTRPPAVASPKPAPPPPNPADSIKVQAILYSTTHASVVVGGRTCEEGDYVAGMKVLKIYRNKILVEWNGQTQELHMN
jgi:thioredoxin-related protein